MSDTTKQSGTQQADAAPYAASPDATPAAGGGIDRETAIREAAYRRFEARGGSDGDEVQDWLDAQAEVDGQ